MTHCKNRQIDGTTGKEETFREMEEKSVRCALWMREQGVEVGDIVGICTHNQMDMYIPCFASLYIGAVFNPWWEAGLTKGKSENGDKSRISIFRDAI